MYGHSSGPSLGSGLTRSIEQAMSLVNLLRVAAIVVREVINALDILSNPLRLVATLRK